MSWRSSSSGTPDFSAAKARRRLAVKSSSGIAPQPSTITVPSAVQRKASTPARNRAVASLTTLTSPFPGAPPSSAHPWACTTPPKRVARCIRNHNIGAPGSFMPIATPTANPAALARSSLCAAYTSWTHPRTRPPPSTASSEATPNGRRPASTGFALARIREGMILICSYYVPNRKGDQEIVSMFPIRLSRHSRRTMGHSDLDPAIHERHRNAGQNVGPTRPLRRRDICAIRFYLDEHNGLESVRCLTWRSIASSGDVTL